MCMYNVYVNVLYSAELAELGQSNATLRPVCKRMGGQTLKCKTAADHTY